MTTTEGWRRSVKGMDNRRGAGLSGLTPARPGPEQVGLTSYARRVPGLRRAGVAQLAGVASSTTPGWSVAI